MTNDKQPASCWHGIPVVVTGGAGFIGKHLVDQLLVLGASVTVLDDGSSGSLADVSVGVRLVEGSVADATVVQQTVDGAAAIFHLAAMASVPACQADPELCKRTNEVGTDVIASAAAKVGATMTFAGSCAVYGKEAKPPISEDATLSPVSVYAKSKLRAEQIIQKYVESGLRATSLRLFNVIGPGQRDNIAYAAVAANFAGQLLRGEPLRIDGDGRQTRDFVPVGFVVDTMLHVGMKPVQGAMNVGTGVPRDLLWLVSALEGIIGAQAAVHFGPPRVGDIQQSWADITRLRDVVGERICKSVDDDVIKSLRDLVAQRSRSRVINSEHLGT